MFLYLGEGKYKKRSDIIGIFDMDTSTVCTATRRFLSVNERQGCIEGDGELPKSFLLCEKREKTASYIPKSGKRARAQKKECSVFLSRLSSTVLAARTASVGHILTEEE